MRVLLAVAAVVAVQLATCEEAPVYWWVYPGMDAENLDIEQAPCKASCTVEQLETYCLALPNCVAFNTHGWLKYSIADMAPDSCDLYVKKDTPQPSPTPSPSPPPPPKIWFWPQPISASMGPGNITVSPALSFSVSPASPLVSAYAARIAKDIFANAAATPTPPGSLSTVNIKVANVNVPLQLGVDESYTLTIPSDGSPATITANTVYGAYMGLQTLSQAIRFDFDAQQYGVAAAPLSITDAPKFAWRGILIDTDRHWLSLRDIYRIIDAMGYAKLNIIHWHIVDWQAWPLESTAYPALWTAAWSARERYTLTDVTTVIAYANARGIRVVPEFDT